MIVPPVNHVANERSGDRPEGEVVAMHPRYQRRHQVTEAHHVPIPAQARQVPESSAKVATKATDAAAAEQTYKAERPPDPPPKFPKRPSFDHINLEAAKASPSSSRNSSLNLSSAAIRRTSGSKGGSGVNFSSSTKLDFNSASAVHAKIGNQLTNKAVGANAAATVSTGAGIGSSNDDKIKSIALAKSAGKHIKQLAVAAKAKADTGEDEKESVYTKAGYISTDPTIPENCKLYHRTLRRAREASATWDGIALVPELLCSSAGNDGAAAEDVLPSHINPSLSFAIHQLLVRAHKSRLKHQHKASGGAAAGSQAQDMKLGTDALLLVADLYHHLTYKFAKAVQMTVTEGSLSYLQSLGRNRDSYTNIRVLNKARDGRYLLVYRSSSSSSTIAFRVLPKDLERIGLAGLVEVYETLPYRQRTEQMTRFLNSKRMDLDDPTWFPADFNYDDAVSVVGRVLAGELAGEAVRKANKARIKLNRNRRFVTVLPYIYTWHYLSLLSGKVLTESASVIISAAVEYIIEEILDLSAAVLLEEHDGTASPTQSNQTAVEGVANRPSAAPDALVLRPSHIANAISEDEELDALLTAVTMIGDGALSNRPILDKSMTSQSKKTIWVTGESCGDQKHTAEIHSNAPSRDLERLAMGNIDVLLGTHLQPNLSGAMVDAIIEKEESKLRCPITRRQLYDPVLASDGHTYEREAILNWLEFSDISPMTEKPFRDKKLVPNQHIRQLLKQKTTKSLQLVEVPGELGKMDTCFATDVILELAALAGCLQMDEALVRRSKRMLLSFVCGMIGRCDKHARMWNNGAVGVMTVLACRQEYQDELPPNRKKIPVGTGYLGSLYQTSAVDMNINDPLSFLHLRMSSLLEMGMGAFGEDPNELANALRAAVVEGESVEETDWHERLSKEERAYSMWRGKLSGGDSNRSRSGSEDDDKRGSLVRQNSKEGKKLKCDPEVQVASQISQGDKADLSTPYSRASDFLAKTRSRWHGIEGAAHIPRFALISFVSLVMKEADTMSHPRKAKLKWDIEALLLLCDLASCHLVDVLKSSNFFASQRKSASISETDIKHSLRLGGL